MGLIPEDGKCLPPPKLVTMNSVWLAGVGWATAVLQNTINHRPAIKAGVHRQVLLATIGWFLGYHLSKHESYVYAKRDRDMIEYVRLHPEDFPTKEKRTYAEIVEPFHPIR